MQSIIVPTINNNDTDALLVAWSKADGEEVRTGETIAVLETTKASFELAAEADGLLQIDAAAGKRYDFGARLGHIFASAEERVTWVSKADVPAPRREGTTHSELIITKPASELIARHGISEEQLRGLGRKLIRARDLEAFVPAPAAREGATALPLRQQGVARVVSRSRETIPASFVVKKIGVDAALGALSQFSKEQKVMAGLADLLVWTVSRQVAEFPTFFGALHDDLTFSPGAGHLGVTFDLGQGLFIPVVRDAASLELKSLAKRLMVFRMKAMRGEFNAEELAGGDLSISLNLDADTVLVQPIILPPQTAMLAIGGVMSELVLDADGQPVPRRYVYLGCAFDHRIINGAGANAFLIAIKRMIESPALDTWR